jgi:hypothetical protein
VFRTRDEDGRERVWTISRHDPEAGIIQFVQFMKDLCVIRLEIALHTEGPSTRAEWTYSVAALEAGHDNFFTLYEDEPFRGRMTRLEGLLNRYLDTNPGH